MEKPTKILILDANSIINRAYYGVRPLTNSKGLHTNAIFGFFNILHKHIEEEKPDFIAAAFDLKTPTFRHKVYSEYKAGRHATPPELLEQFEPVKEMLGAMNISVITCEGFEADDIIGTLARACEDGQIYSVILTGDRDSLQLVSPKITLKYCSQRAGKSEVTIYDPATVLMNYGVLPEQMLDVKSLMGDASDNIPGVPGIGEKTALTLISKFNTLENLYLNLESTEISQRIKEKLVSFKESADQSKFLAEINCNVPINLDISSFKYSGYKEGELYTVLSKLEFGSIIERLKLKPDQAKANSISVLVGKIPFNQENIVKFARNSGSFYFLAGQNGFDNCIICLANDGFMEVLAEEIGVVRYKEFINTVLSTESIMKCTHNMKPLFAYALENNIEIKGECFDALIASYILNPATSGTMQALIHEHLELDGGALDLTTTQDLGTLVTLLPKLYNEIKASLINNEQDKLFFEVEMPLCQVLASMERTGFLIDKKVLEDFSEELQKSLSTLTKEIYDLAGFEFNIGSPKQLGELLFEKLMLPVRRKIKTGYSTNADVLDSLKDYHPIIGLILNFRQISKLKSTYCDGLIKAIGTDGRIHSSFNQTITQTGRISSTEPNLQNIPVRTKLGKEIRRMFVAAPGQVLIDADYSQIELRVLAALSGDAEMIKAFRENIDIHTLTAGQVFNVPEVMVNSIMRSRAKAVNFGIVYGISDFSLAADIGVTKKEAAQYISTYFETYPGILKYMENMIIEAKENGFVKTILNRRRYLPELTASNFHTRSFGERVARNAPIQGSAADIIKMAMVKVYKRLKDEGKMAKLILQVHDELIIEAPENEALEVAVLLKEEMENAITMTVPFTVSIEKGTSWFDTK